MRNGLIKFFELILLQQQQQQTTVIIVNDNKKKKKRKRERFFLFKDNNTPMKIKYCLYIFVFFCTEINSHGIKCKYIS